MAAFPIERSLVYRGIKNTKIEVKKALAAGDIPSAKENLAFILRQLEENFRELNSEGLRVAAWGAAVSKSFLPDTHLNFSVMEMRYKMALGLPLETQPPKQPVRTPSLKYRVLRFLHLTPGAKL